MRFSRNLQSHRVPLWAHLYLDYDGLRAKISRVMTESAGIPPQRHIPVIVDDIRYAMGQVQQTYGKIYSGIWDECERLSMTATLLDQSNWDPTDEHELYFHLVALTQCSTALNQLREYGILNARGFKRLLLKLNHLGLTSGLLDEMASALSEAQFSNQLRLVHDVGRINLAVEKITEVLSCGSFISRRALVLDHFIQHSSITIKDPSHIYQAIRYDNHLSVAVFIRNVSQTANQRQSPDKGLLMVLIHLSIIYGSTECLRSTVRALESLDEGRHFATSDLPLVICKIIVKVGQHRAFSRCLNQTASKSPMQTTPTYSHQALSLLCDLLRDWSIHLPTALSSPEPILGRSPLHYIAQYGLADLCHALLSQIEDGINNNPEYCSAVLSEDHLHNSPLRTSIAGSFDEVSALLLSPIQRSGGLKAQSWELASGPLLADSLRFCPKIFRCLLGTDPNLNGQGVGGQTVLYAAASFGNVEVVRRLLEHGANAAIAENSRGWTPLIAASVEGHIPVVDLLLHSDPNLEYQDKLGWTALDHAAFRGHITLSRKLRQTARPSSFHNCVSGPSIRSSLFRCPRLAPSESVILVNLGSFDSNTAQVPVYLYPVQGVWEATGNPGFDISIQVSLIGGDAQSYSADLPILEDMTNHPWAFYTRHPAHARLLFKILRRNLDLGSAQLYEHLGSAVALFASLTRAVGAGKNSLIRDHTIPILSTCGLHDIGKITFSFLIVTSFVHRGPPVLAKDRLLGNCGPTKVVGHRGLGQNSLNPTTLSIGENTSLSFSKAMELGADGVELDVQLTKDLVPVVYHDFLVSETGTDAWVHDLSLQQFMHVSHSQSRPVMTSTQQLCSPRARSYSLESDSDCRPIHLAGQLKNTFEFSVKGFKGNTRGDYIHERFLTLCEVLSQTADDVSLSIELKYPMHFEATHDWQSDTFPIEANLFVDTILATILAHPSCSSRSILLSSFSPEICILLALKQDIFPILFLNDSGNYPTGDIRASSLQEAMRFAERWRLDGIGMSSEPFVFAPGLVKVAKARGLVTSSYGALNNEPECAMIQAAAGLDIIITDAVRLISETLRKTRSQS